MRPPLVVAGIIIAAVIAGVAYWAGTQSGDDNSNVTTQTTGATSATGVTTDTGTTGVTSTTEDTSTTDISAAEDLTGLNLTVYTAKGYSQPSIKKDLQDIKTLGSTSVTLVPTWYMPQANSNTVMPRPGKTPTDGSLKVAITWAHEAGLKVVLKPHVDVNDESFRGEIQPADHVLWFQAYDAMMTHYAALAANNGVDVFSVGTELKTMSGDTDSFKSLIDKVRARYSGKMTYAANWDEYDQVQFWDSLDYIGVDAYYPLSSPGQTPSVDDLVNAWQTPLSSLKSLSDKWGKPIVFTEIGYPTQADAAAHPYEVVKGQPEDQGAQATAYEAAFRAFADQEWFKGMSWWSWRGDPGQNEDLSIDYTPQGKKAESILADGQGGTRP